MTLRVDQATENEHCKANSIAAADDLEELPKPIRPQRWSRAAESRCVLGLPERAYGGLTTSVLGRSGFSFLGDFQTSAEPIIETPERATDYVLKAIKRGRVSMDDTWVFPRSLSELPSKAA
jgi:hypothetical protein